MRRGLLAEPLEQRILLAADSGLNPFHNYSYEVDVDRNWVASPRDALLVLRAMETYGAGPLSGKSLGEGEPGRETGEATFKFDTNDDEFLSPADFLRVVNHLNSGEGAPGDLIEFQLMATDLQGNPLPNGQVQKGEDFLLSAFVQDIRRSATGVFAGYLDVAYTNPDIFSVVFSETQRLILPADDNLAGEFQLTFQGATSDPIDMNGGFGDILVSMYSALDGLNTIGLSDVTGPTTALVNPINASATTFMVENSFPFPQDGNFRIQVGQELMWVTDVEFQFNPGTGGVTHEFTVVRGHAGTTPAAHAAGTDATLIEGNVEIVRKPTFDEQTQEIDNDFVWEIKFINDFFETDVSSLCVPGGSVVNGVCTGTAPNLITSLPKTVTVEEIAKGVADNAEAFRRSFVTGPDYPNGLTAEDGDRDLQGNLVDPNSFSEVGAFDGNGFPSGTEGDQRLLWTVRLNADEAGTINFEGNPADVPINSDVLVFGQEDAIPTDMIEYNGPAPYVPITVTIVEDISAVNDQYTRDEDSQNNVLNVLDNDSTVAGTLSITGVSNISDGGTVNIVGGGTQLSYTPVSNFFGVETFNYTVTNGLGAFATATVTVTVDEINDAPTAGDDAKSASENTQLTFPLSDLLDNDVVGPSAPPPNETATQVFTNITFSSGSLGGSISVASQGTPTLDDDVVTYTPPSGTTGTETFTYTVTDNGTDRGVPAPRSDTATLTITIGAVNDPPIARDDMLDGTEDVDMNIPASALLANDEPGDPGQTITITSVSPSSQNGGTVQLVGTTVLYSPPEHYFGLDTFTYTITDNGSPALSDTATVTIDLDPVNDPPIAVDDLNIDVDELSSGTDNPIDVMANDSPGPMEESIDSISIVSFTQPANGTVTLDDRGTPADPTDDRLFYEPDPTFVDGTDTFTYTIEDTGGLTDTATVSVNVVPAVRPRARNDALTMDEGDGARTIDVMDNDLPNPGEQTTLLSFSQGTFGSVARDDGGTPNDLSDDQLVYTPNDPNFFGADSFTYTINDTADTGDDSSATVTVTVNPVNDAPTVTVPGGQTTDEDTPLTITGISVADIDDNFAPSPINLRVSLGVANGTLDLATTAGLSFSSGGNGQSSMVFTGTIAALNAALASVTYDPANNFNGSDPLSVSVNDLGNVGGGALTDSDSVPITVNAINDPPELTVPGAQSTVRDVSLVFSTAAGNALSVFDVDADPDDIEMSLSVTSGTLTLGTTAGLTITSGSNGSASITFEGTQSEINAALQGLVYTPNSGFFGNDALNVSVDDLGNNGAGPAGTDDGAVAINVQNFVLSELSGWAYVDSDFDRTMDDNEITLAGIPVTLSGTSMASGPISMTTTTAADGSYSFDVGPGTYQIQLGDVAFMVDAGETAGQQGGKVDDDNDRIYDIIVPQLGLGEDGGAGNNFGKWGLMPEYLSIVELFASSSDEGLLFGTDTSGNQYWHSVLSGWHGVTSASATLSSDLRNVTIQVETESRGTQSKTFSTSDPGIRMMLDSQGGTVLRLDGAPDEMGFDLSAVDGGEGEAPATPPAPETGDGEQYAAAVDQLLAAGEWA